MGARQKNIFARIDAAYYTIEIATRTFYNYDSTSIDTRNMCGEVFKNESLLIGL